MSVGRDDKEDAATTLRWARAELSRIQAELDKLKGMLDTVQLLLESES
jgi:hypothetical protein